MKSRIGYFGEGGRIVDHLRALRQRAVLLGSGIDAEHRGNSRGCSQNGFDVAGRSGQIRDSLKSTNFAAASSLV